VARFKTVVDSLFFITEYLKVLQVPPGETQFLPKTFSGGRDCFFIVAAVRNLQGFGNLEGFAFIVAAVRNLQGFGNLEGFAL